jgi:iron complex transport system substrate-binding protein
VVTVRSAGLLALALALVVVPIAASARSAVPQRIVSLSPTATEDLFAIGAGPQVVAVDDQSNYPPNVPKTKLSGYTPNAEAIAGYRPDLVIVSANLSGIVAALGKLHIRALTFYEELSPDYYSATSKSFTGQVLSLLGLKDIADAADKTGSGYPKLSAEYIVAANPDLIVLADTKCCGQTAAKVKARPGWGSIGALKNGGVVGVSDDVASRWGPRIVQFMRAVALGVKAVAAAK